MADHDDAPDYCPDSEHESESGKAKEKDTAQQYNSMYLANFKDYLLKEELLRAVKEAGFERPSEV